MKFKSLAIVLSACACAVQAFSDVTLPAKDKFKLVLLAGQSNMAGRGTVDPNDNRPHPRVVMLDRTGAWVPCTDPVHFDVDKSGVGPGKTFGEALAESDPSITVGLIPCAVGGSPLAVWEPGKAFKKGKTTWHPYDDCVARAKKAMEQGTLAAILWHQGESDCLRRSGYLYQARFPDFVSRLRKDIGAEGVPLIVGGLHDSDKYARSWFGKILSNTQQATCEYLCGPGSFVPAKDYPLQPDNIHYTREAQQDFGRRYFAAYQDLVSALAADPEGRKKAKLPMYLQAKEIPAEQLKELDLTKLAPVAVQYAFPKGLK